MCDGTGDDTLLQPLTLLYSRYILHSQGSSLSTASLNMSTVMEILLCKYSFISALLCLTSRFTALFFLLSLMFFVYSSVFLSVYYYIRLSRFFLYLYYICLSINIISLLIYLYQSVLIYLSVFLSICLYSIYIYLSISVYLYSVYICLSLYILSVYLSILYLSVYWSICRYVCLHYSVCPSIPICLSINVNISLFVCLSIYILSICLCILYLSVHLSKCLRCIYRLLQKKSTHALNLDVWCYSSCSLDLILSLLQLNEWGSRNVPLLHYLYIYLSCSLTAPVVIRGFESNGSFFRFTYSIESNVEI